MSADPPTSTQLPPPVPFVNTTPRKSLPLESDVGPPTPPKPRISTTPRKDGEREPKSDESPTASSSSPNGLAQSKSWTQLAPTRPFVNGRGNVQLPGAPQRFIPSTSPSSTNSLNMATTKTNGQTSSPATSPVTESKGRWKESGEEKESSPSRPPEESTARPTFSQRTSSRPAPRTSSMSSSSTNTRPSTETVAGAGVGGGSPKLDGGESAVKPSISSHSHLSSISSSSTASPPTPVASPRLFPSPFLASSSTFAQPSNPANNNLSIPKTSVLDRGRPKTPDPFSSSSGGPGYASTSAKRVIPIKTKRHGPRPSAASTLSTSTLDSTVSSSDIDRNRSPSPRTANSTSSSVLDRPRPKTPDPFGSNSSAYSTANASPAGSISATTTRSGSPTLTRNGLGVDDGGGGGGGGQRSSVMDRGRPKTPDSGALFRFGEEDTRSKTPDPTSSSSSNVFAFEAPPISHSVDGHGSRSIMDRPRPRTPDPQGWLDSASTNSSWTTTTTNPRTMATSSNPSFVPSSTSSLPQSNSSNSISRPSFDSTAPSLSTFASSSASSARDQRSRQSTGPTPPLINVDFDFGSSFGSSDTLFGLSDLLSFGSSDSTSSAATPATRATTTRPLDPSPLSTSSPSLPPTNEPASSEPSPRPTHSYSSSSTSINNLRTVPRKEAPKIDPQLELELELERAIPLKSTSFEPSDGLVEQQRKRERESSLNASLAGGFDESERERERDATAWSLEGGGRKTPSSSSGFVSNAMGRMRKKGDSISSMRSIGTAAGSISEASVTTGGSPQPAKRRRRRSLASLLSFASNGGGGDEQRSRTPGPNSIGQPVLTSINGTPANSYPRSHSPIPFLANHDHLDSEFDKTLPPTPIAQSSPDDDRTPPATAAAYQTTYRPDHQRTTSGGNALTRQLSRLRQRSDTSHSSLSSSRSGFQVVSGSTTRTRNVGQTSVSSLSSSRHTHSSSRDDSVDSGYSRTADSTTPFTALPLSEPPTTSSYAIQAPPPSSMPFGRKLVQRLKGQSTTPSRSKTEDGSANSWTMPLKDHENDSSKPRKRPPRRGSFSSLLNMGERSKETDDGKKTLLGMSLAAGRKSDDMLTRGYGRDRGLRKDWEQSERATMSDSGHGAPATTTTGRRSFDLLTDREAIPRRPSTDNLLTLASAKLSKMTISDEAGEPASPSPATPTFASSQKPGINSGDDSSLASGQSTPSFGTPDNTASVIATAQLIKRSDPSPPHASPNPAAAESPLFGRTATSASLVRSDSLRSTPRQPSAGTPFVGREQPRTSLESPSKPPPSAPWKKRGKIPDSGLGSDASMSSAWLDLEDAVGLYSRAVHENQPDRVAIITNTLLPFLKKEEDSPATRTNERLAKRQRDILFSWLATLTMELREMQPAHRGACLEAVAAIAESHFLSAATLENDLAGQARYRTAVVTILQFAVEKLNDKAVYANTLVFSGRVFALAFFRIEGIALKLLRALPPVKRQGLKRILEEAGVREHDLPAVDLEAFPPHLASLCLRDFRSYTSLLLPIVPRPASPDDQYLVRDGDIVVEMSGNWLIRWTASDSDLPFAFYRAYHKQLAALLIPVEAREDIIGQPPMEPSTVITAPGFLFLAASLLDKSDALVHRNLRSVTSIGPNNSNFNTNDSANLSFGQKPKVLELAHRRLVQTMLDIVGGPPVAPGDIADLSWDAESRRHAFSRMLQVWIRACVKRTSMWDTRSIFILLDLIEGLIYTLSYPSPSSSKGSTEDEPSVPKPDERCLEMFDFTFIFSVIKKILLEADNTVTLMRTISFVYAHFEIFTMRPKDRTALCEGIILDEAVFSRLFLSYNQGTRGFWIRLLVWRLSRLGVVAKEQNPNLPPDEGILALFGLLNVRLEAIRKRHDQLEPLDDLPEDEDFFRPKRSTICSTRGVKEAPWTVDELAEAVEEEEGSEFEEEPQELVRAIPPPPSSTNSAGGGSTKKTGDNKTVSKVVSWLKGGLGKNKKGLKVNSLADLDNRIDPFTVERSATVRRPGDPSEDSAPVDADPTQEWPKSPLPTTIETGVVPSKRNSTPPATPEKNGLLSPTMPQRNKSTGSHSSGSDRRKSRPTSPAFFSFEFENGVITRSDVDPTVASTASSSQSSNGGGGLSDASLPTSPIRRTANAHPDPQSAVSPRVSLRFSKRISILPPAALDLLKKEGLRQAVPPIPDQYRRPQSGSEVLHIQKPGYEKKLHPYAVRGLRDLEDSYDEWTDWVARLQEEEDNGGKVNNGKSFVDVVPRLAVSWPTSFTDD